MAGPRTFGLQWKFFAWHILPWKSLLHKAVIALIVPYALTAPVVKND